jgi:hypothetical protein
VLDISFERHTTRGAGDINLEVLLRCCPRLKVLHLDLSPGPKISSGSLQALQHLTVRSI